MADQFICSRCKRKRVLGITDKSTTILKKYKTCTPCREKLQKYRSKIYGSNNGSSNSEGITNVEQSENNKVISEKKEYTTFHQLCSLVYKTLPHNDIDITFYINFDSFIIPKFTTDTVTDTNVLKNLNLNKCILSSINSNYIYPVLNILENTGLHFKFFTSSKSNNNSKYYISYKCINDVKYILRNNSKTLKSNTVVNDQTNESKYITRLNNELHDWIPAKPKSGIDENKISSIEPVFIENDDTWNDLKHMFNCNSKLNLVIDFENSEFKISIVHKRHTDSLIVDNIEEIKILNHQKENNLKGKNNKEENVLKLKSFSEKLNKLQNALNI